MIVRLFLFLIFITLVGCEPSNDSTTKNKLDQKVLASLGDLTVSLPSEWQQFSETGIFCFYLPGNYKEEAVQGIDSLVRQFAGEEGYISLDYGGYSRGQNLTRTSGTVDGRDISITLEQVDGAIETFGAKNIYTLYVQVDDQIYFNMTYYALVDDHFQMAKKIFGTVRIGSQCL